MSKRKPHSRFVCDFKVLIFVVGVFVFVKIHCIWWGLLSDSFPNDDGSHHISTVHMDNALCRWAKLIPIVLQSQKTISCGPLLGKKRKYCHENESTHTDNKCGSRRFQIGITILNDLFSRLSTVGC